MLGLVVSTFDFVIGLVIEGLVIGALARWLIPGKTRLGLVRTIVAGLVGSLVGGLISRDAFGLRYRYAGLVSFVLAVLVAAVVVMFLVRAGRRTRSQ